MTVAARKLSHRPRPLRLIFAIALACGGAGTLIAGDQPTPPPAQGNDAEPVRGLFITVPHPVDSKAVNRVKAATDRFLQNPDHRGVKIVYDFNPDGRASGGSDYGPCHDLAQYLLELQDITTVAFVHADVTGHAVLPVLACKDVVMSSDARLGDVIRDQPKGLKNDQRQFYEDVANGRGRCPAIVLRMADPSIQVLEGLRRGARWYIDKRREAEEVQQGFVVTRRDPPLPPAGLYTAAQAEKLTLCTLIKESRQEIAEAYRLPPRALREDPLQGRTPVVWKIEVTGTINSSLAETLERRIRRAIAQQANFIILQLECGGGDTQTAFDLAEFLRTRTDDSGQNKVMTVAYYTDRAHDTATFLALGCTEIVMDKDAKLGEFGGILAERPQFQDAIGKALETLLNEQGITPLLARGMVDPDLVLHRVRSRTGPVVHKVIDGAQFDKEKDKWLEEGRIKGQDELLAMSAKLAEELGITEFVVDGTPRETLPLIYDHYGLDKEHVHVAGPDWLDDVAAFLRLPAVSLMLVMIGIAGLVLELKMPGVGLPAVISAICFILYFWANSRMNGNFTVLALLLFVLGLILIGLEVFVVPGLGVTGISGIVLMIISLGLVTLVKKPETTQEWLDFGTTISKLALALIGAVAAAFVLGWYLPHIPYANRLVLAPPADADLTLEDEDGEIRHESSLADLLGAIGVAATPLRPAGKANIGEQFVDVVAEGSYVAEGTRVQVVEIEGNRVVVKEVDS
jgi:membrane-bound ClpP family serine protease